MAQAEFGADGAIGGQGGNGYGGATTFTLNGIVNGGTYNVLVRGLGGQGGVDSDSVGGNGGYGEGGTSDLTVGSAASVDATSYSASANGIGGDGGAGATASGDGGDGQGGTNTATFDGLDTHFSGQMLVTAFGQGGNGDTGGSGTGGSSTVTVNGSLTSDTLVQSTAQALGGLGDSFGGDATGSTASLIVNGSLQAGQITVAARATGGNGALGGGDAQGGTVVFNVNSGSSQVSGLSHVEADAIGGNGVTTGVGSAGTVQFTLGSAAVANFADLELSAQSAQGGGGSVGVTGDLTATGRVELVSGGSISFDNVTADEVKFSADGAVTGGNINVADPRRWRAQGAIVLGDITAGPNLPPANDFSVVISSETSITVGNVSGPAGVGFATLGNLTTGDISGGDVVLALVGGDITTGSITTAANGRVYMADASMFITGGGGGSGDFDPNIVLALPPVPTGGAITINGPITTGRMQAAAGTTLTLGDVTASQSAELSAGGLADFQGMVSSPDITVTSGDINVGLGASLGVSGVTNLLTLNAVSDGVPVIIGDTGAAPAPGQYQLDAEQGDIRADAIVINAFDANGGAAPDVLVGDVMIEGSDTPGGGNGSVTVNTDGSILVQGHVDFVNAARHRRAGNQPGESDRGRHRHRRHLA